MAEQPKVSMPTVGLNLDADPLSLKEGEYTYALNATIGSREGHTPFLANEEANIPIAALPSGYMDIGKCRLNKNDTVLMLCTPSGDSEIGIFKNGVYTGVVNFAGLGFNIRFPIQVKYKLNYKGERIIYWVSGNKPPYWMNLDKPNYKKILGPDGCTLIDGPDLDLDFMKIFKDYSRPCITVQKVTDNGRLTSGAYFISGQYADANSNGLTACFPLTGPIPIYYDSISQSYDSIGGIKSEERTGKSILLGISGTDTSFSHINIIVVRVTSGVKRAFKVATISIGTGEYLYTGAGNSEVAIDLSEVIQPAVSYTNAKTIETTASELLLGNLRSEKEFNFQPYASKLQVQWQMFKGWSDDPKTTFKNPTYSAYMRVFRQDEVYALGWVIDWIDGTSSKAWHMPGRKMNLKSDGTGFGPGPHTVSVHASFNNIAGDSLIFIDELNLQIPIGGHITFTGGTANNGTYTVVTAQESISTINGPMRTVVKVVEPITVMATQLMSITIPGGIKDAFGDYVPGINWDDQEVPNGDDVLDISENKRHQVYNTATIEGSMNNGIDPTGLGEYGEMSFWQSTERYECNKDIWGDDAGEPIRHHKMPDSTLLHIHDGQDMRRAYQEKVLLNYLGVKLPNVDDIIASFPAEIKVKVKGWRLVVGDRTYNKSIIASGIMLNARQQNWRYPSDFKDDVRLYPNYPLNDLRQDPYVANGPKPADDPNWVTSNGINNGPFGVSYFSGHDNYRKDAFFFHSPDTHFKKSFLSSGELKITAQIYGETDSWYEFIENYPEFREKDDDMDRAALAGFSVASYNNYKNNPRHQTRRKLSDAFYVPFNSKVSGGNTNRPLWNIFRESSVLLSTTKEIVNPSEPDTSRFILNDADPGHTYDEGFYCQIRNRPRHASIYYATIKNPLPNQYGSIFDIRYNDSYPCRPDDGIPSNIVFAGDTFIGPFSMKTQHVMYQNIDQYIGAENGLEGADLKPAETIAHTRYYYRNRSGGSPRDQSAMMCEDNEGTGVFGIFGDGNPTGLGFLCMLMFGVPNFWAESDFNLDLRYPGQTAAETFYKHLNNGSFKITDWLNIKNIKQDNYFFINEDYSAMNNVKLIQTISPLYDPNADEGNHYSTRVLMSLNSEPEDILDNWIRFKPLDYYDLSKSKGELMDIRYLGNYRTAFRMQQSIFIDTLYRDLSTSEGALSLGNGRLFQKQPNELQSTDGGYAGTCSQFAFNSTEMGAFFLDADKGKVFVIQDTLRDITPGLANWFQNNLPFVLAAQLDIPKDNGCNPEGIGFISEWDPVTEMWFLTKKDYRYIGNGKLRYEGDQLFEGERALSLKDKKLFENVSWTLSYSPANKHWISWHSFLPNFYIAQDLALFSGENNNNSQVWQHHQPGAYHIFYGIKYPFILENADKLDAINTYVNPSISFISRTIGVMDSSKMITFNKAMVYNLYQHSGLLPLIIQDENDLSQLYAQLANTATSRDVALRIREGHFNFSDFYDISVGSSPFFTQDWNNPEYQQNYPIDKVINHAVLDYNKQEGDYSLMRERWIKCRLILDNRHDLKLLLQFVLTQNRPSIS